MSSVIAASAADWRSTEPHSLLRRAFITLLRLMIAANIAKLPELLLH